MESSVKRLVASHSCGAAATTLLLVLANWCCLGFVPSPGSSYRGALGFRLGVGLDKKPADGNDLALLQQQIQEFKELVLETKKLAMQAEERAMQAEERAMQAKQQARKLAMQAEMQAKQQAKRSEERARRADKRIKLLQTDLLQAKKQVETLTRRVDGIVIAFSPAILYATMETSVYLVFAGSNTTFTTGKKNVVMDHKLVLFKAASFAGSVLDSLIANENFKWTGLPNEESLFKVMALKGLLTFVKAAERDQILNWPPDRNPLMHDGKFLSSVFPQFNETPLVQQHLQAFIAFPPSATAPPSVTDQEYGSRLASNTLMAFDETKLIRHNCKGYLEQICRELDCKHDVVVSPSVFNDVKVWIK